MASSSFSSSPLTSSSSLPLPSPSENPKPKLQKEIRNHDIAIAELNALSPSRAVYQKLGNIFFRKNIETAKAFEQKQLDSAKAQLQKLNTT